MSKTLQKPTATRTSLALSWSRFELSVVSSYSCPRERSPNITGPLCASKGNAVSPPLFHFYLTLEYTCCASREHPSTHRRHEAVLTAKGWAERRDGEPKQPRGGRYARTRCAARVTDSVHQPHRPRPWVAAQRGIARRCTRNIAGDIAKRCDNVAYTT